MQRVSDVGDSLRMQVISLSSLAREGEKGEGLWG